MTSSRIVSLIAWTALTAATAGGATTKDLWVPASQVEPARLEGIWPVTGAGVARFVFALPEDYDSLEAARLVLLADRNLVSTYHVLADARADGETLSPSDLDVALDLPVSLSAEVLTEVDVGPALPAGLGDGAGGQDLVSVVVILAPEAIRSVRVFGLRLVYRAARVTTQRIGAGSITGGHVAPGAITERHLRFAGIDGDQVADGAIRGAHFSRGSLTSDRILDRTLTGGHFVEDSIQNTRIADGSVDLDDIAGDAVESLHIANGGLDFFSFRDLGSANVENGSLTGADVKLGSLSGHNVQPGTIGRQKLKGRAVDSTRIRNASVIPSKLATGAVTGAHIVDGELRSHHIRSINGSELSSLRIVRVGCNANNCDTTFGAVCDVAGAGWEPFGASNAHNFSGGGVRFCGGDNRCTSIDAFLVERDSQLYRFCESGTGGDCVVYCIAP